MMATASALRVAKCLVCRAWNLEGDDHQHCGHPDSAFAQDGTLRPDYEAVVARNVALTCPPEARPS